MMKICLYIENYDAGGLDKVIVNIINSWPYEDKILLVCNKSNEGLEKMIKKEIHRDYILLLTPLFLPYSTSRKIKTKRVLDIIKIFWTYGKYVQFMYYIYKLSRFFKNLKIDVIFVHNGGYPAADSARAAVIAAKMAGVKKIFLVIHNIAIKPSLLQVFPEYFIDKLIGKIAKIICVSREAAKELGKNRFLNSDIVIYNGLSINFKSKRISDNLELKETNIIGMIGALSERKGHDILFRALSIIKEYYKLPFKCLIIGGGSNIDEARVRELIKKYKLDEDVILCGFVPNILDYYPLFDVFIFPSVEYESCPMVILEAMSFGVPIIASNVGGVRELIFDEITGFIVPPRNPEKLAEYIVKILENPQLAENMRKKGRFEFAAKFTAERMVKKYYALVHD